MPILLTFLDGVRWQGRPVPGERAQALLAALALAGRTVSADRLISQVWGDDVPANPGKALQVLVSRVRAVIGSERLGTDGDGYRLALTAEQVDVTHLRQESERARHSSDPTTALTHAEAALALTADGIPDAPDGPLGDLLAGAARDHRAARETRARALARTGRAAEALPDLEAIAQSRRDDEPLLADLLHALAAARGPAAALDRYESHRSDLAERLGTDPGPELQRIHRELLALDRPIREGLRYDASPLLGRAADLRALSGMLTTARVVSIVGPGGLGKTRLAHAVARDAGQPVVHFVELVGVTAPEDLVGELGSVLGVRDSVSGRRALTPEQRADVRARIAQQLDQAPTLLVLDNCEHIVDAVADLVAFLVATTRELRVLTTTRAPLAIAAEHVHLLPHLGSSDAVALFRARAEAARPGVPLVDDDIRAVTDRLDGLPLAIELAAAKVRVMRPAEIARRLDDRFALLRGGDRSAPDRHRTLLAVIDWSWALLAERERRALRFLSAFHDGFTLDAADAVLGRDALEAVEELVEQSLLVVADTDHGTRFRMLETVREFGRLQRETAGESAEVDAALRAWAVGYADRHGRRLFTPVQVEAMDDLRAEDTNLADILREAIAAPDPGAAAVLFSALGGYWAISGDHFRGMTITPAFVDAITDWAHPPELADTLRGALCVALFNSRIASPDITEPLVARLRELGPDSTAPSVRALTTVMLAQTPDEIDALTGHPDDRVRSIALQFLAHERENYGDPAAAIDAAQRARTLAPGDEGPWRRAMLDTELSGLHAQFGDLDLAAEHAHAALPVLDRLGAVDDAIQSRAVLATACLMRGDIDTAERLTEEIGRSSVRGTPAAEIAGLTTRAQLALARGDIPGALRLEREAAEATRAVRLPGNDELLTPWSIFGDATALSVFAQYADGDDGADLHAALAAKAELALQPTRPFMDYPVAGLVLFGLGIWALLKQDRPAADAVRLLVLADRFGYHRSAPTMRWERIVSLCEARVPGLVATLQSEYGDRRGPDLLDQARAAVGHILRE
ncbi:BTAD domain-containing putative transcriptional regulator [Nocardioides daejeonensis]|uniref:BTAD domain-containing putative transcriptional regulator n=1 Tax=Nocardioides daejeonensis TaxID=1046556 RepID=UPI000D740483|nr:BTAD domain-containing putative transcriptional regulator [Nocardioides daejeonensis]